jgi:hypothetical protein
MVRTAPIALALAALTLYASPLAAFGTAAAPDSGLSLSIRGSVARVKDQIHEPRPSASDEDILLQQRELGTDYRFSLNVGLSSTFGSVLNNVVNPRMTGGNQY